MGASLSDFQQHFSSLSDEALMEIHRNDLVDAAKAVYDHEMSKRGLVADDADEPQVGPDFSTGGEKLVNVVEFESAQDAGEAQATLKKNGIPAYVAVMVPDAFASKAIQLLDPGVSEEELEALAEAAGEGDH